MPFVLSPSNDPITGQAIYEVPQGTPAVPQKKISDGDYSWGSIKVKVRGKRKTLFLVDNDFAYISNFDNSDTLSLPDTPSAYQILPAPLIEGHVIVVDQRSRTNVIALISDPSGFFL